ncbi:hypothetical protein [Nostoc sp.]
MLHNSPIVAHTLQSLARKALQFMRKQLEIALYSVITDYSGSKLAEI